MDQHINYITLGVADVGRSRRFYQEVFGWQESAESNEHIAFFQTGGALILALFQRDALAKDAGHDSPVTMLGGFPGFSMAHNLATATEVDALFARFREHGVT
ncbi:MAG: VOC family protein, partial [Lautropia mirabilis]|nr:VOC family protein [Lautropia mirabilis]